MGEGSEFADSGIEGATTDTDLLSRRSNATNSSYSPPTGRAFVGSDSGSSSTGDAARQGVYENFRRELEMSTTNSESLEEAGSAHSDEQSSGTLSSPGQSDILLTATQGTVRKAGALAVKNFLVHKKNKKVESATRRKWKHYWVSLKGKKGSILLGSADDALSFVVHLCRCFLITWNFCFMLISKKKVLFYRGKNTYHEEFPLRSNRICRVSGTLGCKFDPWPSPVG